MSPHPLLKRRRHGFPLHDLYPIKPVFTMVIGVAAPAVNGILITGTFDTVIGFDVVIMVMLGGVVFTTGSIFTHFGPVEAAPA